VLCLLQERVGGLELCVVSSGRESSRLRNCVLGLLEERVTGLELRVVSSARESSRLRTLCCVFWKRE